MHYLALACTYTTVDVALFENNKCLEVKSIDKIQASSDILISINKVLDDHTVDLHKLAFIAVNQGPGPFTTLRVVIATANGLSFASRIPLVGVDGFDAFVSQIDTQAVVLLNAFSGDYYYALAKNGTVIKKGYEKKERIFDIINTTFTSGTTSFLGNGALMLKDEIIKQYGDSASFTDPIIESASITTIAKLGKTLFDQGQSTNQLQPLYLKRAIPAHLAHEAKAQ